MKLLAIFLAFVGSFSAAHVNHEQPPTTVLLGNAIDNLVREALEYIRKLGKAHEPVQVPDFLPELELNDDVLQVKMKAKFTDIRLSKAADFDITSIQTNILKMTASMLLHFSRVLIQTKYEVTGTIAGKAVHGNGETRAEATELTAGSNLQLEILDNSLHMKYLHANYTVSSVKIHISGLEIEGMTEEQFEELLNKNVLEFFQTNEEHVANMITVALMKNANIVMKGKTLQELIDWLKNFHF